MVDARILSDKYRELKEWADSAFNYLEKSPDSSIYHTPWFLVQSFKELKKKYNDL